jgi:hypothetical protein
MLAGVAQHHSVAADADAVAVVVKDRGPAAMHTVELERAMRIAAASFASWWRARNWGTQATKWDRLPQEVASQGKFPAMA